MPSQTFSLQESSLWAKLGTGTWAQVQPDLLEPTHPHHSHWAPFFPSGTAEPRPAHSSHTLEPCAQAENPPSGSQLHTAACSMKTREKAPLCLRLSSFPLPSGARDGKLTSLLHLCESHAQAPSRSSSRMFWAGAQGDRHTVLHLLRVCVLRPGMPRAAVPRLPHCLGSLSPQSL